MLFRPDDLVNSLFVYVLACAARRSGVLVHAYCVMSTHVHVVVTDERGVLPAFLQWFHRILAMTMKVLRRWEGSFWDGEKTSVVRLETPEAILDKIAYTLANPVAAGLVATALDWPGARSTVAEIGGGSRLVMRPNLWFDTSRGAWPERVELSLDLPPIFANDPAGFRASVEELLRTKEGVAHAAHRIAHRRIVGADRIRRQKPSMRVARPEPIRKLNPTFAVGAGRPDLSRAASDALRAFRAEYTRALARWRGGARDVTFPRGTWAMRVVHGARCASEVSDDRSQRTSCQLPEDARRAPFPAQLPV